MGFCVGNLGQLKWVDESERKGSYCNLAPEDLRAHTLRAVAPPHPPPAPGETFSSLSHTISLGLQPWTPLMPGPARVAHFLGLLGADQASLLLGSLLETLLRLLGGPLSENALCSFLCTEARGMRGWPPTCCMSLVVGEEPAASGRRGTLGPQQQETHLGPDLATAATQDPELGHVEPVTGTSAGRACGQGKGSRLQGFQGAYALASHPSQRPLQME